MTDLKLGSLTNFFNYNASKGVGPGVNPAQSGSYGVAQTAEGSKTQQSQQAQKPQAGIVYSADQYELANEIASILDGLNNVEDNETIASADYDTAGHQGYMSNPFDANSVYANSQDREVHPNLDEKFLNIAA